jgi:hypothetical protein
VRIRCQDQKGIELSNHGLGNSVVLGQENVNLFFWFAGTDLTPSRVALENGEWLRMLLPLSQTLIGFGGMR